MSTKKVKYSTKSLEKDFGKITFSDLLLAHRKGEELSQREMSELLEISKQSLCDLEKGRRIPSPARAASIAKKLGMIPESFIELAIQDHLREESLNYRVSLSKEVAKKKKAS